MTQAPRQTSLIAFMQAQNCSNCVGSWRHPCVRRWASHDRCVCLARGDRTEALDTMIALRLNA